MPKKKITSEAEADVVPEEVKKASAWLTFVMSVIPLFERIVQLFRRP